MIRETQQLLKLREVIPAAAVEWAGDRHTPLRLVVDPPPTRVSLYWRANVPHRFFEIGLDPDDGRIVQATLVLYPRDVVERRATPRLAGVTEGLATIDISSWGDQADVLDYRRQFRLVLEEDMIRAEFAACSEVRRIVAAGCLVIDVDPAGFVVAVGALVDRQRRDAIVSSLE